MKIIYIPGKPIKRITCPSCHEDHLTGDKDRLDTVLEWKRLHDEGKSYWRISIEAGVSYENIRRLVNKVS